MSFDVSFSVQIGSLFHLTVTIVIHSPFQSKNCFFSFILMIFPPSLRGHWLENCEPKKIGETVKLRFHFKYKTFQFLYLT